MERHLSPADCGDNPIQTIPQAEFRSRAEPPVSVKCGSCSGEIALLPCPFCGAAAETRWNAMTGEHYIAHIDWNSRCPLRVFYGAAELWNERQLERRLLTDIEALRSIQASKNEQIHRLCVQYRELAERCDVDAEHARRECEGLRAELSATQAAQRVSVVRINELLRDIERMRGEVGDVKNQIKKAAHQGMEGARRAYADMTAEAKLQEKVAKIELEAMRAENERLRAEVERLRGALELIKKESIDCYAREIAEQMLAHGRL